MTTRPRRLQLRNKQAKVQLRKRITNDCVVEIVVITQYHIYLTSQEKSSNTRHWHSPRSLITFRDTLHYLAIMEANKEMVIGHYLKEMHAVILEFPLEILTGTAIKIHL